MQDSIDQESFHLLQISDSASDSLPDLDLVSPNTNFKKKKVRLKRRDRNQSSGRPGVGGASLGGKASGSEDEGLCGLVLPTGATTNNNCYLIIISTSALIILLLLAYITSSLHTRVGSLEQQLRMKIADEDSKDSKLELLDSRVELMLTNQSQVVETIRKLVMNSKDTEEHLLRLNSSLVQEVQRGKAKNTRLTEIRRDLELLTNISRNNEDSVKQMTDILTSLNITQQSDLVKTREGGRP